MGLKPITTQITKGKVVAAPPAIGKVVAAPPPAIGKVVAAPPAKAPTAPLPKPASRRPSSGLPLKKRGPARGASGDDL